MTLFRIWMLPAVLLFSCLIMGVQADDPQGDLLPEATSPAFDLIHYSTSFAPGQLVVTLTFAPGTAADFEWLSGYVDFDTDQNLNTGGGPHFDGYVDPPFAEIGVDYYISFTPFATTAELSHCSGGWDLLVAEPEVTIDGDTVTVWVPRCHSTPCAGIVVGAKFDSVILIGNGGDWFTDRAPNDASVIRATAGPGDLDEDGDVDSADYTLFAACMTGPDNGPVSGACQRAKLDTDADVDQADFGLLQSAFTGAF